MGTTLKIRTYKLIWESAPTGERVTHGHCTYSQTDIRERAEVCTNWREGLHTDIALRISIPNTGWQKKKHDNTQKAQHVTGNNREHSSTEGAQQVTGNMAASQ